MLQLKKGLRRYAAATQLTHSEDVVNKAKASSDVMGLVGPLVTNLESKLAVQRKYFMLTRSSRFTRKIQKMDRVAYRMYWTYVQSVNTHVLDDEDEKQEAALQLKAQIVSSGISSKSKRPRRLGKLLKIVEELSTTYATQVQLLGLDDEVADLKVVVESVHESTVQRTEERKNIPLGAHNAARKESEKAYADLMTALNGLAVVDTDGKLTDLILFIRTDRTRLDLSELGHGTTGTTDGGNGSSTSGSEVPGGQEPEGDGSGNEGEQGSEVPSEGDEGSEGSGDSGSGTTDDPDSPFHP